MNDKYIELLNDIEVEMHMGEHDMALYIAEKAMEIAEIFEDWNMALLFKIQIVKIQARIGNE